MVISNKFVFCKKHGKYKKTDQHDIDTDEIETGHDWHTQVTVIQDTDKVTDIHDGSTCTGIT